MDGFSRRRGRATPRSRCSGVPPTRLRVRAGLRVLLAGASWPEGLEPRVRIAIHTGEAHERDGDFFGPALNRAARLRALAPGAATLLSQATTEIVHDHLPPGTELIDLGSMELRGLSRPEQVFELRTTAAATDAISPPEHETRKTITVLFACVIEASPPAEAPDAEARRRASSRYLDGMRAVFERHGGTVEKYIGDAIMAVFGVPTLHEDDALRAVRAAVEMRDRLPRSIAISKRCGMSGWPTGPASTPAR